MRVQHRELVETARRRFGIEESGLMFIATHDHSGPALPSGFDPGISWGLDDAEMRKLHAASDRIRDQIVDAIARALSDLQPARLLFGREGRVRGESARAQEQSAVRPCASRCICDGLARRLKLELPGGRPK